MESDTFVDLALQKTGSTFIVSTLSDLLGAQVVGAKHGRLLDQERSKFVFGSIRNPWDLYVSLRSDGCQGEGKMRKKATQRNLAAARRQLPRLGPLVHAATKPTGRWRAHYSEPHSPEKFRRWLVDVHTPWRAAEFEPAFGATRMRRVAGFATYRYCDVYTSDLNSVLGGCDGIGSQGGRVGELPPPGDDPVRALGRRPAVATLAAGCVVDEALEQKVRDRAARPVNRWSTSPTGSTTTTQRGSSCAGATP